MMSSEPEKIRLSREQINALPLAGYQGAIEVVEEAVAAERAVALLRQEPLLGFDTETRPSFRPGEHHLPALLQLAGADCVYLFRINRLRHLEPLAELLANAVIIKAGVAVRDDLSGLQQRVVFTPAGFVDLGDAARRAKLEAHGLRNLSAALLGFRISKGAQRSNWGQHQLTAAQIRYAATDAWIGRLLYLHMSAAGLLNA